MPKSSGFPIYGSCAGGKVVSLPVKVKLICSVCNEPGEGSCTCGAPYVPAPVRVAAYDKANPGRSTRQAAADLGVNQKTVSRARNSGEACASPATVTGRDGKTYAARSKPKAKPVKEEDIPSEEEAEESYQANLYEAATLSVERMADKTRRKFFAYLRRRYPDV